jgi:hypothetical protein
VLIFRTVIVVITLAAGSIIVIITRAAGSSIVVITRAAGSNIVVITRAAGSNIGRLGGDTQRSRTASRCLSEWTRLVTLITVSDTNNEIRPSGNK